ncbi:MAG TPA: porin [Pirellulaceae bacterium]|nr:porin [Pirellulaceae bacterium]
MRSFVARRFALLMLLLPFSLTATHRVAAQESFEPWSRPIVRPAAWPEGEPGYASVASDRAFPRAPEESVDGPGGDPAIRSLEERIEALEQATAKPKSDDVPSDKWSVKLGGHVQSETVMWANAGPTIPGPENYFEFRRLRLVADGVGYGVYDFRLQMTLEPEAVGASPPGTVTSPDVKDAYLSMNELPLLGRFRIGNFFVPFGLEQVTNDTNNLFLERSIPTQGIFTPDREVGIAFYDCTEDQSITWAYGAFFDSISEGLKERLDDNQGHRVSGRITWMPFYDEATKGRYLIYTGAGILYTKDQDGRHRLSARPQVHEGPRLIDSGTIFSPSYTTGNLELAVVNGPFAVQAEAYRSEIDLTAGGVASADGCYVHGSWFLTGENRIFERFGQHGAQFARSKPTTIFSRRGPDCGWGGLELKSRWSYLDLEDLQAGQYNDLTVGFNWYWSDRIRWMVDWIHPITSSGTVVGATESDLLGVRFDFNW